MKQIIAVDVDDVLAANAKGFVEFSNRVWGTNLAVGDYDEHWQKVWKVDLEETKRRAEYLHSSKIFEQYEHFSEAKPVLQKLAQRFELVVVTSRRKAIQAVTLAWIDKYFGGVFANVHFAGIWDDITDSSIHLTKSDVLADVGASYLIDDQLKHCVGASEVGVRAILFGDYGWNQAETLPASITRCSSWKAVEEYFDGRAH